MNNIITINSTRPFVIVSAHYTDLTGQVKTFKSGQPQRGLFLVARVDDTNHVLAFKITSQCDRFINEFTYLLPQDRHPFLKTDSYVQFDKWHTLNVNNCTIIGSVHPNYRMALLRKWDLISSEVDKAFKDNIFAGISNVSYTSPNKPKVNNKGNYINVSKRKYN